VRRALARACAPLAAVAVFVAGCGDGGSDDSGAGIPTTCGLPTPKSGLDTSIMPEAFLLDGAELANVARERGGFTAVVNVPYSVGEALDLLRGAVRRTNYEIIGEDNEGFEAELYLRRKRELGAVQIRRSICDRASIVFVNVVPIRR
jgi:hypothetical protein